MCLGRRAFHAQLIRIRADSYLPYNKLVCTDRQLTKGECLHLLLSAALTFSHEVGQNHSKAVGDTRHAQRLYRPEWEGDLLNVAHIYAYLARGHWFRTVRGIGTIAIGCNTISVGIHLLGQQLEVRFDPQDHLFLFYDARGYLVARRPPSNLNKKYLMGPLANPLELAFFQLALPFPGAPQQVLRLFETMPVTN